LPPSDHIKEHSHGQVFQRPVFFETDPVEWSLEAFSEACLSVEGPDGRAIQPKLFYFHACLHAILDGSPPFDRRKDLPTCQKYAQILLGAARKERASIIAKRKALYQNVCPS